MALTTTPLIIPGGFGGVELVVVLLIAVLLFGANKIPKLARATGQAMGEFQRGREELEEEIEEMNEEVESATDIDAETDSVGTDSSSSSEKN